MDKDKPQDEPQDSTEVDQGPQDPQCKDYIKHGLPLQWFDCETVRGKGFIHEIPLRTVQRSIDSKPTLGAVQGFTMGMNSQWVILFNNLIHG
jgi:hypothetical protein